MSLIFYIFIAIIFVLIIAGAVSFVVSIAKQHQQEEIEKEVKEEYPYHAKKFFFTKSEQEFFRILSDLLDKQRFTIFTKVRLADFVEVKKSEEEYQKWWNKIRSKHVDFIIWDISESKIAAAIEVDGKSHSSPKMITNDAFKDELYAAIGIPLNRVVVGSDFKIEAEKLILSLDIRSTQPASKTLT